jgi:hypothetical protein
MDLKKEMKLSEEDKKKIELATEEVNKASLVAETAKSKLELADSKRQYMVLDIYYRYGLSPEDQIDQEGNITRTEVKEEVKDES